MLGWEDFKLNAGKHDFVERPLPRTRSAASVLRVDDSGVRRSDVAARAPTESARPGPRTDTTRLFARFPHLAEPIGLTWGTPEGRQYLGSLMIDSRGGTRQGFPAEHASTIFKLILEHDNDFPQCENQVPRWQVSAR